MVAIPDDRQMTLVIADSTGVKWCSAIAITKYLGYRRGRYAIRKHVSQINKRPVRALFPGYWQYQLQPNTNFINKCGYLQLLTHSGMRKAHNLRANLMDCLFQNATDEMKYLLARAANGTLYRSLRGTTTNHRKRRHSADQKCQQVIHIH